jgi:hypothetical protein
MLLHRAPRRLWLSGGLRRLAAGGLPQEIDLLAREVAPLADGETLQLDGSERCAADLLHGVSELEHERADLQVAVLAELEVDHGLLAVAGDELERAPRRRVARARAEDLAFDSRDGALVEASLERDVVALRHAVARVGESIRQLAVVREEEQPRAVEVEPSDAVEPRPLGVLHEVDRARPPARVAVRAHRSARLEEHDVDMLLGLAQGLSVDLDAVGRGIDPRGQRVDALAIHRHGAREDQLLALAARGDSSVCERLLQAHASRLVRELAKVALGATG